MVRASVLLGFLLASTAVDAATIETVYTHGSFETAGVIVKLSDDDGDETVRLEVKGPDDADFREAHPFVRYDGHDLATSLFELAADTAYELRITLDDPDGVAGDNPRTANVRTRAALVAPAPTRTVWVGSDGRDEADAGGEGDPFASIQFALEQAQPGDEIRVLSGTYGPVSVTATGSAEAPIVVRADDPGSKPVIDGDQQGVALRLEESAHVWIDGFEVTNAGEDGYDGGVGVSFRASSNLVLMNCFVHDNGYQDVLVSRSDEFPGDVDEGGHHVIQDNVIADTDGVDCGGSTGEPCPGETYYGIMQDENPGGGTVIRRNEIYGHGDQAHVCGDETPGRQLREDTEGVLALTGGSAGWTNHDLDFYDNDLHDSRDDDIETDGICVNARLFRNHFGDAHNVVSVAPALPGPYFWVRNELDGTANEGEIKMNTGGRSDVAERNIFFYHNTIARSNAGTLLRLWFAVEGDHNVPIHNVVFRNNVFWARAGGALTDADDCLTDAAGCNLGDEQPSFDYDLWFTTDATDLFEWFNGSGVDAYDTLAAFQAGAGQEAHGVFGDPGLDADLRPGAGSPGVDQGVVIPGINDSFGGDAPDIGAHEVGEPGGDGDADADADGDSDADADGDGDADADGDGDADTESGEGGCCRTAPGRPTTTWPIVMAPALLLWMRRRRR